MAANKGVVATASAKRLHSNALLSVCVKENVPQTDQRRSYHNFTCAYKSIKYKLCNLKAECTNLAKEFTTAVFLDVNSTALFFK